ncbi:MAG: S16 family serine protease [Myxococcota bacterium]|jgi:hypothetical protein|nr:S16 family serine protease [Myxococcota bacterium]
MRLRLVLLLSTLSIMLACQKEKPAESEKPAEPPAAETIQPDESPAPVVAVAEPDVVVEEELPAPVEEPGPKVLKLPVKPLEARQEAKVQAVWFQGEPGTEKAKGGTSDMTVRVEANAAAEPAVGVMEEFAEGTGKQWRSSAWLAAFNASQALGLSITDHEFMVKVGGHIDGPSAGMLMTATMMALITATPLLPDTTMTGTINPDGTAGPVGGIPQKMSGAKDKGIKRFGYPLGSRNSTDLKTMQIVDVDEVGRKLGLEVMEIRDIWDAYTFLTGVEVERPEALSESEMELNGEMRTQLNAKVLSWKGRIRGDMPKLEQLITQLEAQGSNAQLNKLQLGDFVSHGNHLESVKQLQKTADELATQAENYEKNGLISAAYVTWVQLAFVVRLLQYEAEFSKAAIALDLAPIDTLITGLSAVDARVESLAMEAKVQAQKKTIGGRVNAIYALTSYAQAYTYLRLASASLSEANNMFADFQSGKRNANDAKALAEFFTTLRRPILFYAGADAMVDVAKEMMSLGAEEGTALQGDLSDAAALAKGLCSAAGANIAYFDSLVTDEIARHYQLTAEVAQNVVGELEFDYPIIRFSSDYASYADHLFAEEKDSVAPFQLAFGVYAYIGASTLVNKYYSLGANMKDDGSIDIGNVRALTYQLDSAKTRALQSAAQAKRELGFVPAAALRSYQLAVALREGSDQDKLSALEAFWYATFWSQIAIDFGRER